MTDEEVYEGEYEDEAPVAGERSLVLSDSVAMASRLAEMKNQTALMRRFIDEAMVLNVDYGPAPGQVVAHGQKQKLMLFKAGAEKLCELYGFAIRIGEIERERDGDHLRAQVTVQLVRKADGEVVAEGIGEANTYEARYRWRWVGGNRLPRGLDAKALVSREGRSSNGDHYIQYRVENDDLAALHNTVLKMAKKRALVDAVLSATRSSGMFEDAEGGHDPESPGSVAGGGSNQAPAGRGAKGRDELTQFWQATRELGYGREAVEEFAAQVAGKAMSETTAEDRASVLAGLREAKEAK